MPAEKTSVNESAIPWPAKPSTIVTSKTDRKSRFARPPVLSVARVRENWFWVSPGMAQYCPEPALVSREDFCPCLPLSGGLGRKRVSHNFSKRRPGGLRLTALRHSSGRGRPRDRHAGRGGLPQEINLRRGQGVGLVDEVAEGALQFQGFGGEGVGGVDGAGVLVPQSLNSCGGQGQFLAPDTLHFADPGVGIEVGCGEKLVAGLFNSVFQTQPVEQRALGLLLAGGDFNQALDGFFCC